MPSVPPTAAELRALQRRDPALRELLRRHPFPAFPLARQRRRSYYETLARDIVYQQLAGNAAETIYRRVCALTPGPRFPSAAAFLRIPEAELRRAGLSRNKFLSLYDLSEHVVSGRLRLRSLHRLPDEAVIENLVQVRGIGVWTAQMFLMFRLGRLDVLPSGDLGVREGARRLMGLAQRPTPQQVLERGARWAPLRSVGAWLMWRLCEQEL